MTAARGPRVVVTRPREQADAWMQQLAVGGISAAALPLIGIVGMDDAGAIDREWSRLARRALAVFASSNAVDHFFARRPDDAVAWPDGTLAAAPGPGTAQSLRAVGVPAGAVLEPAADSAQFDSESLWEQLRQRSWRDASVLFVRGSGGRDWLVDRLVEAGAQVASVDSYRRTAPRWSPAEQATLARVLDAPREWAWLFTSSEGIGHLVDLAVAADWPAHRAVCTHPRIAERARAAGFGQVDVTSPSSGAVVACIQSMQP